MQSTLRARSIQSRDTFDMVDFTQLESRSKPIVIAHRGASGHRYENTIEAFELAIEMGAGGIEIDVRRSRDGVLLVHHDARLRGHEQFIRDMTASDIRQSARRRGYEVPTLAETVGWCAGRIALDVELKEVGYEAKVVSEVAQRYEPGNVVYTSFHDSSVSALKGYATGSMVGLLIGHNLFTLARRDRREYLPIRRLRRCGADFIAPHWQLMRLGFWHRLHRLGIPIAVWTVNRRYHARRLAKRGVNLIISDYPDRIMAALAAGK